MKNTNYIINGVLVVAVIVLFILHFTGRGNAADQGTEVAPDTTIVRLPVAYINVDSLLTNYNFAKDLNETLLSKSESSSAVINQKYQQLQKEFMDYQMKRQNNAFLTRERQAQEEERLTRKQQELEDLAARTENEFLAERTKINQQMEDTIVASLKTYNEPKKYHIIFSNAGTSPIFIADDAYNITSEVIEFLNKRYIPKEK